MKHKIFMWYDNGDGSPMNGPHFTVDVDRIGQKMCHTLEDLLKLDISPSLKKKLSSAKEGTTVMIHYLHSNGELCVKRLHEKDIPLVSKMIDNYGRMSEMRKELSSLDAQNNQTIKKLKLQGSENRY